VSNLKKIAKRATIDLCKLLERSPSRSHEAIVTLMHEVGGLPSDYNITEPVFKAQLNYLLEQNVSWSLATELAGVIKRLDTHKVVCITFDDGTLSSYNATLELLEAGANCTHFIIPDRVNRKDVKSMSWSQLRELNSVGVEIGSHSLTHPYLTRLAKHDLDEELNTSKSILEDELGKPVTSFAYPYGDYDRRVVDAVVEAGYACAFTTRHLYAPRECDVFQIPRFEPLESLQHLVEIYQGQGHWFYRLLGDYYKLRDRLSS
jgi:peptidoglycan/xylan/chitin deacetylase (PgdA/CDA1 family)